MRQYTLQELAEAADMTIRNVRSYQTRGLIPPPQRRGRRSMYTDTHLERLREIHAARARGASLALIAHHLSQGGSLDGVGLQSSWLPFSRRRGAARSGPADVSVPIDGVLSESTTPQRRLDRTIDQLVTEGVLARNGQHVLADRVLATGLAGAVTHGLEVAQALELVSATADAARSIHEALEEALTVAAQNAQNGRDAVQYRRDLLELVSWTLTRVVPDQPTS